MLADVLAFLVIAYSGYPPYVLFYVLDNFKVNIYKSCRSYIALKYTVIDILIWKKCFDMMLISDFIFFILKRKNALRMHLSANLENRKYV